MDKGTYTREPQRLMLDLIERKIRLRAHQLYEERRDAAGSALSDWLQAEEEVLNTSILAPLYWRSRHGVSHSASG
ncbi:MAG: DUF2934 domain-containing protein [Terriglobales bacterium]